MKSYTPNFNDSRIQKRMKSSLNYALACLSEKKARAWSTRQIDVWFGSQHNDLSKWIRSQLLIVDNSYYNSYTGKTKTYLLNTEGVTFFLNILNMQNIPSALDLTQEKIRAADNLYGKTIENNCFVYKEKSSRLWNDIQRLENDIRKPLFANYGYIHEYDIRSSAPNILTQFARQSGMTRPTPTIDDYLKDPEYYRLELAKFLDVDRKTAKQLINSRFAGARFGKENSIIEQLNNNWEKHNLLKQSLWFELLTKDIKKIWDAIKQSESLGRMNSSTKWGIYFREELRVMRAVHRYLDKTSVRYFHEHDGWRCDSAVDIRELKLHISKQTGYMIEFDWEVFELDRK